MSDLMAQLLLSADSSMLRGNPRPDKGAKARRLGALVTSADHPAAPETTGERRSLGVGTSVPTDLRREQLK
ncbi:hypothetical protein BST44_09675 [Mycobacterium scrofulaceum]|uniref:Uncharacterized protein n=1 Tax=Mycobacterium scrofulaceum TaxID=1783 RepID=A0A1X0KH34_MYCSC|nr:hypothetical protein BST44_09675 [Mycobacterium scrofulaceum]